ncbi:T9SS type B sorting domain-containing protein [Allomuricauda sp. SCSIO 65647]|uniref:T9SS type B sorting domain-containing protein n=1 Tax=Allomuricauda sp. SCSIO 65647 TaxID=2908843 RepID=UPI001F3A2480|nr:T9SS type B sorting domain-containing protein [Muricauda sp. SCSIO 65647]UJH67700.1 T9SS type B sorting domain-containing protein [Muricauda sp. SCSIO 65647]
MRCLIAIIFILFSGFLLAQREAANWYFGQYAGLDFNSGTPIPLTDGQINTVEGCEAFSDGDGNLLFYTEGKSVWNRFHNLMPNGIELGGSFSTTQSALVVPNPVRNNIYYIFTPDDALAYRLGTSNGFNYSVVNMLLDNGRGDIVEKNTTLLAQCSEKVSAVRNATDNYYWVVTHYRNQFYSYRVDANGVSTSPVISTIGPLISNSENIRGSLKISPDGTKLAIAHTIVEPEFEGSLYLFDFNVDTGVVSNATLVSDERVYYGVEFSSNSSKLYASGVSLTTVDGEKITDEIEIVQYDLESMSIPASEYQVAHFNRRINDGFVAGALQIAIDKKIYHSIPNERLSVIRTPNLQGLDSDFRRFGVDLGGRAASYGLPPFIQSFFETIVTIENFCEGDTTQFTTDSTGAITSIHWNFGDPLSGSANFSTDLNPTHVFTAHGTYTVTIEVEYSNGTSRTFLEFVEIAEIPNVVQSVSLVQCDVDGNDDGITQFNLNEAIVLFNNGNEDITANFFTTLQDAQNNENVIDPIGFQNNFNGEILYARAFENSECFQIVEVALIVRPLTDLGFYRELQICDGTVALLAAEVNMQEVYDQLFVDFGDDLSLYATEDHALLELEELELENRIFGPFDPLQAYFRVENQNDCAAIGFVTLDVEQKPEYEEVVKVVSCNGEAVLTGLDGFDTYLWPDGSTDQEYTVQTTGTFDLIFGNGDCSYLQSFEVVDEAPFEVEEIIVEDFTQRNSVTIITQIPDTIENVQFSLDNGLTFQDSNTFSNLLPGVYDLVVSDGCTEIMETILVGGVLPFFTPNSDGINDRWTLMNPEFFPDVVISVFDRYGKLMKTFRHDDLGWDGTFDRRQMPSDDYWYKLQLGEGRIITGHFALKR